MVRKNEITSTEKLLDLIRGKAEALSPDRADQNPAKTAQNNSSPKPVKITSGKKANVNKPAVVGIDIGYDSLRLVKTVNGADSVPELVDQRRIAIPSSLERGSAGFVNFLREGLDDFCGPNKKFKLWAIMSAAHVSVHHITIPKVPRKQLENVVLWNVKKEMPFDEKEYILDFDVLGEVTEQGVAKSAIIYYTAPKQEIEETRKLFTRAGRPLTGLSIVPFAVQNILRTRWLSGADGTITSLFIGNEFSRIDIYAKGNLVMTRGIKAGISSMTEVLIEGITKKGPFGSGEVPPDKSKAREILNSLSAGLPSLPAAVRYGLEEEEILKMLMPVMERLVRQVERTFEHYTINLGNERVEKIYVSGSINLSKRLAEYVGGQLGIASEIFDPLNAQSACFDDKGSQFTCIAERIAFVPALGMALSDNSHTPNFLLTFKDKEREANVKRINMTIFGVFLASVSLLGGVFFYQWHAIAQKNKVLFELERKLAQYSPPVSRDLVMNVLKSVRGEVSTAKSYRKRYEGLAIISELANLAAPDIRLVSVKVGLGGLPERPKEEVKAGAADIDKDEAEKTQAKQDEMKETPKKESNTVEIEGVVVGEKKALQTGLADYVMKLSKSPLFREIKVQRTTAENLRRIALLRFAITIKLAEN